MPLGRLCRFVHASNLELDRFCTAGVELTPEQGRALIDAPFRSAERVFELAAREAADFILLSGGVFSAAQCSTWGISYLARQCERVRRAGIDVVWVEPGRHEAGRWPAFLPRPDNLHLLPGASGAPLHLRRGGVAIEVHAGSESAPGPAAAGPSGREGEIVRIMVTPQPPAAAPPVTAPIDYWAVAGGGVAESWPTARGMARAAGTPQPRHPGTGQPGGCLVVDVGPEHALATRFVETNSIRFHTELISVDDGMNRDACVRQLIGQLEQVVRQTTADVVAIRTVARGHGPVIEQLLGTEAAQGLRAELEAALQPQTSSLWLECPVVEPDAVQESRWQRDRSAFGGFVRALDGVTTGPGGEVDLTRLGASPVHAIDPAAAQVPRPHYQTTLKAAARRIAASALARAGR